MTPIQNQINGAQRRPFAAPSKNTLWATAIALCAAVGLLALSCGTRAVYIHDNGSMQLQLTLSQDPHQILQSCGIVTRRGDKVRFSGFSGRTGVISIERMVPVLLQVDGRRTAHQVVDTTVAELLQRQNIRLGPYDEVTPSLDTRLTADDCVTVRRVRYETETVQETLPYATVYKENCLLRPGRTRVLIEGQEGLRALTYEQKFVDGVLQERRRTDVTLLRAPQEQLVLRGTADPVSDLDFGVPLDESGVPVRYKKLLANQVCTGYSAGKGAYGASYMDLFDGSVAVRADEIPYGTKLYITSADNSFVYGFAIAADTGVGLMQNVIDIDLFYETYVESCLNGRKNLNVYILE